ncbi:EAL domain-containing protein [Ureibacillus acetophenoni]|uniref:PAS domain S-box-containing protein/diguanylate cyclase (GGDEF)-like protein n=1 Tax=Ureibacillus acetophenoni TaxID=614649 RepID=A0A285UA17_9BACL|nr:EAL domain-containing protein [Ureibacillus acetophenoni]SOC38537.1 PAS domain S-box-containing protein/diguanylate cyclase (GGDEF)-like protein [Ureibacillus acetophenoni]
MRGLFKKTKELKSFELLTEWDLKPEVYEHLNAVIKLDINGKIISYNQAFMKQFGYDKQDFIESFFDVFIKYNSLDIVQYFEKALLGNAQKFNTIGVTKDGKNVEINITMVPIKNKAVKEVFVIIDDTTKFQNQKKELDQFKIMQNAFDQLDYICSFYYDAINDFLYFSNQINNMLQIESEKQFTPSMKHFLRFIHPEDRERVKSAFETALKERRAFQLQYRLVRKDQTTILVQEQFGILLDGKGNLDGVVGFVQDIINHKLLDNILEKEKQIKEIYDNLDVGIWSLDLKSGRTVSYSKGIEYISGYTKDEFNMGLDWGSVVHKADHQQYLGVQFKLGEGKIIHHQYRIITKNGDIRWILDYTIPTLDEKGNLIRLDGVITDITEKILLEDKIKYLANYDSLTNLPNRNKFIEELEQLIYEYSNTNHHFAVVKLNINGFKYINNTLGNEVGDELLKRFPNRIKSYLSPTDIVARRGGDEFMLLIKKVESIDSLKEKIKQITECLKEPFSIDKYKLYVTASIGVCTYPEDGSTSLELMRNASLALQNAEKEGYGTYHILSHSSSIQSFKNYSIGRDLMNAIENKELVLYFQPRVDSNSNRIIGAEALIRWNHPEWGLISPDEFLTIAEENGLITEIDDWVLDKVCYQIKKWKDAGVNIVPISVNISAVHFMQPDLPSKVESTIRDAGIQPNNIEFEITESMILNNSEMVKKSISKLKELGIKIVLDDFGKGYSSLSYLTQYPFDVVKIDKSFIRNMHDGERNMHLVKSIIYMSKGLNLRVVAEGVETIQQLKTLQQEQCTEVQGYLFSHPVSVNEFEALLQKEILSPVDPNEKLKHDRRKHYRLNFPVPLEADMRLTSIAGRIVKLGVSNVLVMDISAGGLRFVSNLKLPIRGDVIYQFKTELLGESINLKGSIVWKEEMNEDITEYGIKFSLGSEEQTSVSALLNSFIILSKSSDSLPSYRKASVFGINEYFK